MPVPAKRHPSSKVGRRRSHLALKKSALGKCSQCGRVVTQHTACAFCGYYKGKSVLKVKTRPKKKKEG